MGNVGRVRIAVLGLSLLLLVPQALAWQRLEGRFDDASTLFDEAAGYTPTIPVPCLVVLASLDGVSLPEQRLPAGCDAPERILVTWDGDGVTGSLTGALEYRASPSGPSGSPRNLVDKIIQPDRAGVGLASEEMVVMGATVRRVGLSPLSQLADALTPRVRMSEIITEGEGDILLSARWDVRWDAGDCRSSRASLVVFAQGKRVTPPAPDALLHAACISTAPPSVGLPALGIATRVEIPAPSLLPTGAIARALAEVVARVPEGAQVALALDALARTLPSPALALPASSLPGTAPLVGAAAGLGVGAPSGQAVGALGGFDADASLRRAHAEVAAANLLVTPLADATTSATLDADASPLLGRLAEGAEIPSTTTVATRPPTRASAFPTEEDAEAPQHLPASAGIPAAPSTGSRPADARHVPADPSPGAAPPPRAPADDALRAVAFAVGAGFLLFVAWALYQRILRPKALDHEGRRALYDACAALHAPATAGELAARVGMERKTAEYHLVYLERLQLVRAHADPDGPRRFALPIVRAPVADAPLAERLVGALAERPGASAIEVATTLGITRMRADRRMKDLVLEGVVETRVEEGTRRYYLATPPPAHG